MMGNLFSVSLVLSILLLPFLGRFVGLPHGVIWAYIVGCFIPPGIGLALYYYGGRDFSFNPFASLFAGLLCAFGAHMKSSLT